ncbi:SDR family NAD(P)-dependent oxidoreductase [Nocardia terpenica]|uniref:SDR family NAD(P)-dependent oxidoreductase n=1 Tax=Nocardia terpenica TaxID=455432 RepID=UPI001892EE70|nr:SDR family NAD(P)-dependent oxidoreductase [Nocardia terpenica]MBF6059866.1 SDR family NAD(P)-dependent oxidoreductase [Nocardia terpenica]MBF6102593.1 SDR family NAD(P)-dependent oxidoreductase [Nocardia terpenica]MBF6111216.1 SDR family NAD(P)-dependent oxidoreductase [Nocardia terpenica]MBF6117347.1 SDR family NAD(P)-dependent oxidoreductase [Nocardia terpenica]MBF6150812.1 SDR family NAD(P)-dependent oxidoreductase [Nocardia terpenica]
MNLRDARVLLTGATGGIGHALAIDLAARSGEVVLTGRRTELLEPLAEKLHGRAIPADLTDRDAIEDLLKAAGEIDVLVANAALPATGLLTDYSIGEIDRALDVNLRAPIVMAKLAGQRMAARRHGHLVFISSLSGKTASGQASLYNATKFGMRGFALALREDMRPHNVGVSTVFPGYISDAGMFADSGATLPRGIGTRTPRDVARATIRAIEKDLAEVDVAPLSLRLIALFGGVAPGSSAATQRLLGASRITGQLAEGQRYKR